jgi:hypothetical protein
MATDEMRTITTDKWSDDVWGVSSSVPTLSESETEQDPETKSQVQPPAQLYFYFGRNDHWVAERTREEIVKARGVSKISTGNGKGPGPRMVVCEESVPHAFCLSRLFFFLLRLLLWWRREFTDMVYLEHNEVMAGKVSDMVREILR